MEVRLIAGDEVQRRRVDELATLLHAPERGARGHVQVVSAAALHLVFKRRGWL